MRSFGISVGIAGLARLLRVLLPSQAWLAEALALLAAFVLVINVVFVLRDGVSSALSRLANSEEGAYAAWSACTLALLSTFKVFAPLGAALWLLSLMAGASFAVLGVRDLWRSRDTVDPAHLSWFAWLGICASTVPAIVAELSADLSKDLALTWAATATFVLLACWRRLLVHGSFRGARSPWFALGAGSGLALWLMNQVTQPLQVPLLVLTGLLSLVWLTPILQLVVRRPAPRAAWPNLFPLTCIALFAAQCHGFGVAAGLALWAGVIAVIEVKNHVPSVVTHAWRQAGERREAKQAQA